MSFPPPVAAAQMVSQEPIPAALLRIRDLIYETAGIFQSDTKLRLLQQRCERRMQVLGVTSLREYYHCLTALPIRQAELVSLLNEITIGETSFFRNRPQFEALRKVVLPRIMAAKANLNLPVIRIWSAGCSTGEEPYTLAIALLEQAPGLLKGWSFEVHATNINDRSIAMAQAGVYGEYSLRNTEPYFLQKYFTANDNKFTIAQQLKSVVRFSRLNLFDDAPMSSMKAMDLIVCCNVLIYFDRVSKTRVVQQFSRSLLSHGYLFLGHAESLYGISDEFQLVHLPSAIAYMKVRPDCEPQGMKHE
jgi:chemotaxis protein methyltransferase CheR